LDLGIGQIEVPKGNRWPGRKWGRDWFGRSSFKIYDASFRSSVDADSRELGEQCLACGIDSLLDGRGIFNFAVFDVIGNRVEPVSEHLFAGAPYVFLGLSGN